MGEPPPLPLISLILVVILVAILPLHLCKYLPAFNYSVVCVLFRRLNSIGVAREWGMRSIKRFSIFKSRLPLDLSKAALLWNIAIHFHNLVARHDNINQVRNVFYVAPSSQASVSCACGPACFCTRMRRAAVSEMEETVFANATSI